VHPEVHVRVEEPGQHPPAGAVDHLGAVRHRHPGADGLDPAGAHEHRAAVDHRAVDRHHPPAGERRQVGGH